MVYRLQEFLVRLYAFKGCTFNGGGASLHAIYKAPREIPAVIDF